VYELPQSSDSATGCSNSNSDPITLAHFPSSRKTRCAHKLPPISDRATACGNSNPITSSVSAFFSHIWNGTNSIAIVGLFSNVALNEMTDSFWQYLATASGLRSARRGGGYHVDGISQHRSRPRRILGQLRSENCAPHSHQFQHGTDLGAALFVLGLCKILRSFQPNPIVAVVVFLGAAAAATSFVATYVIVLFGAAAGGI
jgi:hypothetical protein